MAVGTISGCYLFYRYFKLIDNNYIKNGIIVGLSWFAINILLDSVILIPIMKTTFVYYFMTIGIGYISITAISIAIGFSLERKKSINME